ncbi:MAG: DUF6062 family protein [Candidatus Bathyarchaeia archaeon]
MLTITILEGMEKSEAHPLCYLWTKREKSYVKQVLTNEVVTGSEFRKKVVAARGFCNRHAYMLYQAINESGIEDGLEYALYMKDVIEKLGKQLSSLHTNLLNASKPPGRQNVVSEKIKYYRVK